MNQASVHSFNVDPFPIPRPFEEYRIAIGDTVTFRTKMGEQNDLLIAEIISQMGSEPLKVVQLGTRKHRLRSGSGQEAWASKLFLVPEGVPPDE